MSLLSKASLEKIDHEINKYPPEQKQSAVMSALRIAQEEHGWLSTEVMDSVAAYLGMPTIAVYEVATFYEMYNTKPMGKYKLTLCTNLPCALSGADAVCKKLKERLGIDFNEVTADGLFSLKEGQCFGACGDAPVLLINNHEMRSFVSEEKLDDLLKELQS
ncbi:MAG: NADH-quinone oxidoreductase subunit E [Ferrovum sp. 37-45-19]|uniref:NADH-quinone oxidoreductase subunit NuoE n=1 Tax=Ferrovum sp. JA12 TaxID=1356299 RepID=UPI0007036A89|nr:NADH-quinone oxidoreductase subunit NuoE [Ferrovum sp. JA12]OYV79670.1 MAG: NADH-quinone oxidoreductase subunit E [Ferrovum sp. 21-44-67]OYV94348.1 MAG: NADH-quinone oxidoreductase subunit E [Ferrovum sp. 37-45-19]OZB32352.1 MAG: NADH-quinone oxidoreductase subunit E [Ferrovum sp. 34-44-207]HQT80605.1 NADH-quinone oxidoreductase subunit NuoE [Ferrovaceae bacterium]KRH79694.1 NADH-quinone oxidoreductase subunit 2 [Ferrovum sp. JA12]